MSNRIALERAKSAQAHLRDMLGWPTWLGTLGIGFREDGGYRLEAGVTELSQTVLDSIPSEIDGVEVEVHHVGRIRLQDSDESCATHIGFNKMTHDRATAAMKSIERLLMSTPGVSGFGVVATDCSRSNHFVEVGASRDTISSVRSRLPATVNGVDILVRIVEPARVLKNVQNQLGDVAALPSGRAWRSFVEDGDADSLGAALMHTGLRAALIGAGLLAVGSNRKTLVRDAVTGSLGVDAFILAWTLCH